MMKNISNRASLLFLFGILLLGFHIMVLPSLTNPMPYGEIDAAYHTAMIERIALDGKLPEYEPDYVTHVRSDAKYINPPAYHSSISGFLTLIGIENYLRDIRFIIASLSVIGFIGTYLLARYLFKNNISGLTAVTFQALSFRVAYEFAYGQWGLLLSFSFIPFLIYLLLRAIETKNNRLHLLSFLFIGLEFLIHPLAFFVICLFLLGIFAMHRKELLNMIKFVPITVILMLVFLPTLVQWESYNSVRIDDSDRRDILQGLFFPKTLGNVGYPSWYFTDYNRIYGIPFLVLLVIALFTSFTKREKADKILLLPAVIIFLISRSFLVSGVFYTYEARILSFLSIIIFCLVGGIWRLKYLQNKKFFYLFVLLLLSAFIWQFSKRVKLGMDFYSYNLGRGERFYPMRMSPILYDLSMYIKENMSDYTFAYFPVVRINPEREVAWIKIVAKNNKIEAAKMLPNRTLDLSGIDYIIRTEPKDSEENVFLVPVTENMTITYSEIEIDTHTR